ncbi:MAG: SMC-Scp complex subunit ScpB [Bdellovibrionota bacterium]|nr:MAG: SMC-Scp complex subunit ScpB [Bdellovibrionota bacterium]
MDENSSEVIQDQPEEPTTPESAPAFTPGEYTLAALVEALLFTAGEPLSFEQLSSITRAEDAALKAAIEAIHARHDIEESGFELVTVGDRFQFRSHPAFAPFIRELRASRPRRLSGPALETLAIVAYRQPIVKSDIEKIRGVDVTPTLKTLLERSLVRIVGHQSSPGQPALYGTTDEFLSLFGLRSLEELPTLRDIKELEREPGESPQEEIQNETAGEQPLEAAGNEASEESTLQ